jgi:hypothetical protein
MILMVWYVVLDIGRLVMFPGKLSTSLLVSFLAYSTGTAVVTAQTHGEGNQSKATAQQAVGRNGLTIDQARMLVKEVPGVDIKATLTRWKLQEPELVKLRKWSGLLAEDPGRTDLLSQWGEFMTQMRAKNLQLQGPDVASLIQMLMLASYEEANKSPEPYAEKVKFYNQMKERIRGNLTEARQMQALLRSQRQDPLSGSLIRLPANQRALQKCQVRPGSTLNLDCQEVLISTTTELEDYVGTSEDLVKKAEDEARLAELEQQKAKEKRQQILLALSDTAKRMYDTAVANIQKNGK